MKKRLLAIINPISGGGTGRAWPQKLSQLAQFSDCQLVPQLTKKAGDARLLASSAALNGFDGVIAIGGDGTLNEIVNGLGVNGLPLLVIPIGTGNAFARAIGASRDLAYNAGRLKNWKCKSVDLGCIQNNRLFTSFTGVGFDAECVKEYHDWRTAHVPVWRYVPQMASIMLRSIRASQFSNLCLTIDRKEIADDISWLLVANSKNFGGPMQWVRHASIEDGLLDVIFLQRKVTLSVVLKMALGATVHRAHWMKGISFSKGKKIQITSKEPLKTLVPYEVDGDFTGHLPIEIEVVPKALNIFE